MKADSTALLKDSRTYATHLSAFFKTLLICSINFEKTKLKLGDIFTPFFYTNFLHHFVHQFFTKIFYVILYTNFLQKSFTSFCTPIFYKNLLHHFDNQFFTPSFTTIFKTNIVYQFYTKILHFYTDYFYTKNVGFHQNFCFFLHPLFYINV